MASRLNGKVVIISGASSGIGLATARAMTSEGAQVTMFSIEQKAIIDRAEEIRARGGDVLPLFADVTKREDWDMVVRKTVEKYGKITTLVNNAGVGDPHRIGDDFDWDHWMRVISIIEFGTIFGCQAVIPELKKIGRGCSIINCASLAAITAMAGPNAYTCAKGAVLAFSRALAMQLGPYKIRCNAYSPGIILTPMMPFFIDGKVDESLPAYKQRAPYWLKKIKLGEFGTAEDIANALVFLASDESGHITGTNLVVDGGYNIE